MSKMQSLADYSDVNSKSSRPIARNVEVRPIGRQQDLHLKSNDVDNSDKKNDTDNKLTTDSLDEQTQDKPSSSAARPKEGGSSFLSPACNFLLYFIIIYAASVTHII